MSLSITIKKCNTQHYGTWHSILFCSVSFKQSVTNKPIILSVIMLNVIMLSVIMLSVVVPFMLSVNM